MIRPPGIAPNLRFRVPGMELKNPSSPEIRKKNTKTSRNPPPRVGPRKYEKNTEKIRKRSLSDCFRIFSVFIFRIFGARPWVGDFVTFSYFFRISGLEGFFLSSIPGTRNHKFGGGPTVLQEPCLNGTLGFA